MNPPGLPMLPHGTAPPMIPLVASNGPRPRAPPDTGPLTVFVGKLPQDLHDNNVRSLLDRVGTVVSWKRTTDPISGKSKAFGYCVYATALDCIRALKLLNGFSLDSKNILLKVDATTQAKLDAYTAALHPQLRFEEDRKNERTAAMLQRLFEERSGVHGGYNNDISSWGDLIQEDGQGSREVVRGGMIMSEVEKFRLAQEERAAQIEAKRLALIQERLRKDKEDAEKREAAENEAAEEQLAPKVEPPKKEIRSSEKHEDRKDDRRNDRRASPRRDRRRERSRSRSRSRSRDRRHRDSRRRSRSRSRGRYHHKSPERFNERASTTTNTRPPPPPPPAATVQVEEVKKHNGHVGKVEMKLQKKERDQKPTSAPQAPPSNPVFAVEEEEEVKPHRGFVPLDYTDEEKLAATIEAQVARTVARINSRSDGLEGIIKNIPTEIKELFRYPMDWQAVEQFKLVEEKMRPWVKKKIVEYLGEEEDTLIGFILRQLKQRVGAQTIVDELSPVLEQDAEAFVVSMWRKLIFEVIRAISDHEK